MPVFPLKTESLVRGKHITPSTVSATKINPHQSCGLNPIPAKVLDKCALEHYPVHHKS